MNANQTRNRTPNPIKVDKIILCNLPRLSILEPRRRITPPATIRVKITISPMLVVIKNLEVATR